MDWDEKCDAEVVALLKQLQARDVVAVVVASPVGSTNCAHWLSVPAEAGSSDRVVRMLATAAAQIMRGNVKDLTGH